MLHAYQNQMILLTDSSLPRGQMVRLWVLKRSCILNLVLKNLKDHMFEVESLQNYINNI